MQDDAKLYGETKQDSQGPQRLHKSDKLSIRCLVDEAMLQDGEHSHLEYVTNYVQNMEEQDPDETPIWKPVSTCSFAAP